MKLIETPKEPLFFIGRHTCWSCGAVYELDETDAGTTARTGPSAEGMVAWCPHCSYPNSIINPRLA